MAGFPTGGQWPISSFDDPAIPPPREPPVILADAIGDDGDYTSLTRSGDPLDQHIRHTFKTLRDTGPCARDHGHRLREIRYSDQLTLETVTSLCEEALKHLVDRGYCELERVELNGEGDEGLAHIVVRDRVNNQRREFDVL